MKKWGQIEAKINKQLNKVNAKIASKLPDKEKMQEFFEPFQKKMNTQVKSDKFQKISKILLAILNVKGHLIFIKKQAFDFLEWLQELSKINRETKKENKFVRFFKKWGKIAFENIEKIKNTTRRQVAFFSLIFMIVGFGSFVMFDSAERIWLNMREPASILPEKERSSYYQLHKRMMTILNLRIPLNYKSETQVTSVVIEFSVQCSNKFTCKYLLERETPFKDYLLRHLEPTPSEFVFDGEGRGVLLDKVRSEINNFLKLHRIDGEAIEVGIVYIMGT